MYISADERVYHVNLIRVNKRRAYTGSGVRGGVLYNEYGIV